MFYNLGARALFMARTRLTDLGFIYINPYKPRVYFTVAQIGANNHTNHVNNGV